MKEIITNHTNFRRNALLLAHSCGKLKQNSALSRPNLVVNVKRQGIPAYNYQNP